MPHVLPILRVRTAILSAHVKFLLKLWWFATHQKLEDFTDCCVVIILEKTIVLNLSQWVRFYSVARSFFHKDLTFLSAKWFASSINLKPQGIKTKPVYLLLRQPNRIGVLVSVFSLFRTYSDFSPSSLFSGELKLWENYEGGVEYLYFCEIKLGKKPMVSLMKIVKYLDRYLLVIPDEFSCFWFFFCSLFEIAQEYNFYDTKMLK